MRGGNFRPEWCEWHDVSDRRWHTDRGVQHSVDGGFWTARQHFIPPWKQPDPGAFQCSISYWFKISILPFYMCSNSSLFLPEPFASTPAVKVQMHSLFSTAINTHWPAALNLKLAQNGRGGGGFLVLLNWTETEAIGEEKMGENVRNVLKLYV